MSKRLGHQAVVIGGSIAGLTSARVLSEFFEQVVVVERDDIEDRPIVHKSVPQGNHIHGLLQGGEQALSDLYPALAEDLHAHGATPVVMGQDAAWYFPDGKAYNPTGSVKASFKSELQGHCVSRGLLECLIRRRTLALPNIRFVAGCGVRELLYGEGRVQGVRCDGPRSIAAELVVDAAGRGSRARQFLASHGFPAPEETRITYDLALSSATFRMPPSYSGEALVFIQVSPPVIARRGAVFTIEGGALMVSLMGRFGDVPPTDKAGFLAFAKDLHCDIAYRVIEQGEQLSEISHHKFPSSVLHHYERMTSLPEGFVVIGDALCAFNPVFGQGMSLAAKQAIALRETLAEHAEQSRGLSGVAAGFFAKVSELNSTPWHLAASYDLAYPQTQGVRPPGFAEQARYFAALDSLQPGDPEVRKMMTEVLHLLRPLSALQEDPYRSRALERMQG